MPVIKLPSGFKKENKTDVANLHTALAALKIKIDPKALAEKKIEATTTEALKKVQEELKLPVTGEPDEKTLSAINTQVQDQFITANKYRTANLHSLLDKLKIEVSKDEKNKRITGETTRKAIEAFQKKEGLPVNGKLSEDVVAKMQDEVVKERFYSPAKNQRGILHSTLQKVNKIAKLNLEIAPDELKSKTLGDTSVNLIKAFQQKYKLPVTGEVNSATLEKLKSVAASKGTFVKKIGAPAVSQLKTVTKELRLNTTSPKVAELQKNLSYLGYKISEQEFKTQTFGKTTTKALSAFQKARGIAITGQYDKATSSVISKLIATANPGAVPVHRYRIRGSVRNQLWERKNEMVIKIFELILDKESDTPLAAKKTFLNGFFDIAYDAPLNTTNGQVKDKFHLVVKLYAVADQNNPVAVQTHYNVNEIHWVNFTESINADGTVNYNGKYLGESAFEITGKALQQAIGNKPITEIKETAADKQISQLSLQTGLSTDEIMFHVLSHLVSQTVNIPVLTPEVYYAFISQNLPPELPGDLLRGTSDWETIAQLTELASSGIAFLEASLQQQALENAVSQNLVTQKIKVNRDAIVQALTALRTNFTLTKPILTGNGNLKTLLENSTVSADNFPKVANVFINNKGINTGFWSEIKSLEPQIGAEAVADFTTTVELANISKNHIPTVQFLKNNTGAGKKFKIASDVAKLDQAGMVDLINQNPGEKVPANIPGDSESEKISNYAAALKSRAEFLYPAVALVATIKRDANASLEKINEVEKFIDTQQTLDFRNQNIDKFLLDNDIQLDNKTKEEVKLVQRVHKLTTSAAAGSALIDAGLHSSMQIYFMGPTRVAGLLTAKGVEEKQAVRLYESSKMQYMKVLARITDFRREMFRDTPAAIIPHTYTAQEVREALGDIPDLKTLFGSLDFCDCEHCKSLYGPAAYLTDVLRFLKQHLAVDPAKTVKDVLFERRPDLGNIKLNCENTNTPLPYIDLVCEILENNLTGNKNFIFQTTLSQKELRAIPENIQPAAYTKLADEDFPMNISFNLWQEEARSYLNYLRVPRYELMETFQNRVNPAAKVPEDVSIAAEYFNLSWKEKDLVITSRPTPPDQNKYWGLDTSKSIVDVSLFMKRSKLTYYQVLELLMVRFVNDPANNKSVIERNLDTCDTEQQTINNLTPAKFDLMHRFIRLWRKTGWNMWELDLLLRNEKIGNGTLDGNALIQLKLLKQLQEKLKLPFETLLAFYGDINREVRIKPDAPDAIIQPHYNKLFQNISSTNPIDTRFKAIGNLNEKLQPIDPSLPFDLLTLDSNILLQVNADGYSPVPTILSALAIRQTDFDLLVGKTDNHLSLNSLSVLFRHVYLARGLKLSIQDMILLLEVTNIADPFADLQATINCIENFEQIRSSGLSVLQLDYILNYRPDSPVGLRDESIAQLIEGLRRILEDTRNNINFLNQLIAFDADALTPLTDADAIMALFSPFQSTLIAAKSDLSGADVSAEEIKFINGFDKSKLDPPNADANKTTLVTNIKKVQTSANSLLSNTIIQKHNQVVSQVASSFSIITEQANVLLTNLSLAPSTTSLLAELENENLIEKDGAGLYKKIDRTNFPVHFNIYTLLHKSARVVSGMKIETENLEYFITNGTELKTINFSSLPVSAAVTTNQFSQWLNLHLFLSFKSKFPEPENASIRSILDLAKNSASTTLQIKTEIAALTKWDEGDGTVKNLTAIETVIGLRHTGTDLDYTNAETYHRLVKCFEQMRLTGADAATMFSWTVIKRNEVPESDGVTIDATKIDKLVAQQTRQAVKSKYEQEDWLSKITPLQDDLREMKRRALVEYHIDFSMRTAGDLVFGSAAPIPNPGWKDSNSLFKYFLIDVEMSACQLTSRIKQAISSVQLFVQRCFLNLENRFVVVTQDDKEDRSSPNAWSQWQWMKNYRVWEANRKIFFYPENWLEPELRDDKSPFFKELENDLMQNEVTKENAETAFLNYLHKMDEVSHLEVCGLYHQMEDLNPDEAGYEVNMVHVIGRTKAIPNIYYYRTYDMNYSTWSAWDKIDVDITGDHVVPVVYNRKLHLFWLQFMEKPMKAKKVPAAQATTGPTDAPDPLKVIEVQLGWTVKKPGGWSSKKISKQKLIHPWERPYYSYNLKPYYLSKFNELYLDIYLSTSKEFNNNKFYDPNKSLNPSAPNGFLTNPTYLTGNRYNETFLPWHSSSFIFNGDVKDLKLKGLGGTYYINGLTFWLDDSYNYVHENFGEAGNGIKALQPIEFGPRLRLPTGMHFNNNHLTNNSVNSVNTSKLVVLENTNSTTLLNGTSDPFDLVITQQDLQLNTMTTDHPMFYQDGQRAFFVKPEWEARLNNYGQVIGQNRKYRFLPFYHPYTMLFIREFNRDGIDGLLNRKIQVQPQTFAPLNNFNFNSYAPTSSSITDSTAQTDIVDFSFGGAYAGYNWELFFHAPLLIACRLMQNQKFEDAMTWFHYIFNPTNIEGTSTPQRYWVLKPFYEYNSDEYRKQRIESILSNLNLSENSEQLKAWRNNPFKPHVIARYRPVAYQKNVVMKYLDNLIAWGDMLFKRDTIESINEASLLYTLAYEILGDRPQKVPTIKHDELTFNEIENKLDDFGNASIDVQVEDTLLPVTVVPIDSSAEPIPKLDMFYFCIPNNDYLSKYWDTVEDRLYKIRHCMNIAGIVRQLPLFEPPIDPALLVKAAAAGIDLNSVLNDVAAPTPFYRFRIVVQKAIEFCNEVKMLGEKLLSALEKKDVEQLSLMRSQQEIQLLQASREIKKKQIDEAAEAISSLNKAKESSEEKKMYYEGREFMNTAETVAMTLSGISTALDAAIAAGYIISGGLKLIPSFLAGGAGFGGTPTVSATIGGQQIGNSAEMAVQTIRSIATALDKGAAIASTLGSYGRRKDEWDFQGRLATIETDQIQFQINAAEIRQAIAEKELENHEMQIENAKAIDDYMRNKYTNEQLYSWMITQVSAVYFQAYQLAFDMAKKAEKCYMYELGIADSNIVQFGYWDSLKKGLLSGDKLINDLHRLEAEYINQNKREFEIIKHISLSQIAPLSLITLKETGQCTVSLPEWLFDMDYPGHYMRRIKNVSISIPCIVGPYTGVNCTLSLLRNEARMDATLNGGAYAKVDENDSRFKTMFGAISSIATSHAQNDSGMFELNFNDDRYLPFEGAGVISDWQISMPKENNYFDFASLSDVILHISYTSKNGGGLLTTGANAQLKEILPGETSRLFSLKHEFSTEWHQFLNPAGGADQEFKVTLTPEHFPFFIRGKLNTIQIKSVDIFIERKDESAPGYMANIKVTNAASIDDIEVNADPNFNTVPHASRNLSAQALGNVSLKIKMNTPDNDFKSLTAEQISNVFIVFKLGS
jgi:peptidoglycan hydrolase-like protein with peptidoglycan-binding domain